MTEKDRLRSDNTPALEIPNDTGDILGASLSPSPAVVPRGAGTTFQETGALPDESSWFPSQARSIGLINVSDVIAPRRFRRVYQSVNVRQNKLYYGSIFLRFSTHGLIAEELGALSPGSSRPTIMPSRTAATRTLPNATIRSPQQATPSSSPQIAREQIPATTMPTNSVLGDRLNNLETGVSTVNDAVDLDGLNEEMRAEDTDTGLQDMMELIRPRSWTRHTVLNIRFKYPLMEGIGAGENARTNTVPYGEITPTREYFDRMERLASLQNTYVSFNMFANMNHVIEIPYPVGSQLPVTFDIINHNGLYSANVNMSVSALIGRQDD